MATNKIHDVRCDKCNKLLAKAYWGAVEIKCPYCNTMNNRFIQVTDVMQVMKNPHQK